MKRKEWKGVTKRKEKKEARSEGEQRRTRAIEEVKIRSIKKKGDEREETREAKGKREN